MATFTVTWAFDGACDASKGVEDAGPLWPAIDAAKTRPGSATLDRSRPVDPGDAATRTPSVRVDDLR